MDTAALEPDATATCTRTHASAANEQTNEHSGHIRYGTHYTVLPVDHFYGTIAHGGNCTVHMYRLLIVEYPSWQTLRATSRRLTTDDGSPLSDDTATTSNPPPHHHPRAK
jgi:hypothetical protein